MISACTKCINPVLTKEHVPVPNKSMLIDGEARGLGATAYAVP